MPANTSPIFTLTPRVDGVQYTSTDTTTKKTIFTPGTNGSRIDGITVASTDTAAVLLNVYLNDGTTDFFLGSVNVPAGTGYSGGARVDVLASLGTPATGALVLPSGRTLKAACNATMTASKVLDLLVQGGDF